MARSASDKAASAVKRAGVKGVNKPKRTPNHPTKSHIVVAKEGDKVKTIRFGQQGVSGSPPKKNESEAAKKRRASFKARHAKNIAKGKMSAAYWASKEKW
jgi:phage gp16-like protein